jgi:hypothetical protein
MRSAALPSLEGLDELDGLDECRFLWRTFAEILGDELNTDEAEEEEEDEEEGEDEDCADEAVVSTFPDWHLAPLSQEEAAAKQQQLRPIKHI